jgi:uncharacterized membrane protein YeaQ/YmgE (transglycosylase-associated protein family)
MIVDFIIWLIIGAIAGWLAGLIVEGYGFGPIGNIIVGIVGALIAGWLLPQIGFVLVGGLIAAIINAVIGAVILLLIIGVFKRATTCIRHSVNAVCGAASAGAGCCPWPRSSSTSRHPETWGHTGLCMAAASTNPARKSSGSQ